jgi:hypothetical protein
MNDLKCIPVMRKEAVQRTNLRTVEEKMELVIFLMNKSEERNSQEIADLGLLFIDIKKELRHGQWVDWLKRHVKIAPVTVQRYMKYSKAVRKTSPVTFLGYAKASLLISALPENELRRFIEKKHNINDTEKFVAEMSKRELEQVLKRSKKNEKFTCDTELVTGKVSITKSKKAFHTNFEYLHACLAALLDFIEEQRHDCLSHNDYCKAVFMMCNDAILRLQAINPEALIPP